MCKMFVFNGEFILDLLRWGVFGVDCLREQVARIVLGSMCSCTFVLRLGKISRGGRAEKLTVRMAVFAIIRLLWAFLCKISERLSYGQLSVLGIVYVARMYLGRFK